ncbi:MAG TPA: hypothetical protein VK638_28530 [Edaphobacter sp.]|nr:hypothetical protein [Edaphobacter sp.]
MTTILPVPKIGDRVSFKHKKRVHWEYGTVVGIRSQNPMVFHLRDHNPWMIGHADGRIEECMEQTVHYRRIEQVVSAEVGCECTRTHCPDREWVTANWI